MAGKKFARVAEGRHFVTEWRRHFKLSAAELARRAEMSESFLNQIEKRTSSLSLKTLGQLAEAMHISRGMLLDINPEKVDLQVEKDGHIWVAEAKAMVLPVQALLRQLEEADFLLSTTRGVLAVIVARVLKERAVKRGKT